MAWAPATHKPLRAKRAKRSKGFADINKKHNQAEYNKTRTNQKFYSSTPWKRLSKRYRAANPLCQLCLSKDSLKHADVVDHIKEIKDGGAKLDEINLQSLCHACHNTKTARERYKRR